MKRITLIFVRLSAVAFCGVLAGCNTVGTPRDLVRGKGYEPDNVFIGQNPLPCKIRRVAVLPLVCDETDATMAEGRANLEPVLMEELIKTKKFEIVPSDSEFLKGRVGQADWSSDAPLPPEFLALLQDRFGCDAVLFSRLTVFRAYPPLAVGWRMRLVDVQNGRTIWAADEVFNGGESSVGDGARHHQLTEERDPSGPPDEWFIQNSPAKFGEYTAARLLATLPPRVP